MLSVLTVQKAASDKTIRQTNKITVATIMYGMSLRISECPIQEILLEPPNMVHH